MTKASLRTPIAIIGMGKSGESAHKLLLSRGLKASDLVTFDQKSPAQFSDPETLMKQVRPQTLVVSPGVPLQSPWLQEARKAGVAFTSEINLACEALTTEKVIGITGSLGKSTTVSLLGEAARSLDSNTFVGGNLGTPFCDYALAVESGARPRARWIVLELSSYQLENCERLKLDLSGITYLSPNHLERYANLEEYYQTKWGLLAKTKGKMYLNAKGGDLLSFAQRQQDFSRCVICSSGDPNLQELHLKESALFGQHNQDNLALAAQIALACHWPKEAVLAMKRFSGLEHRIENVGIFRGIQFINDSKATALDSVITAVEVARAHLSAPGTLHLLLGGKDKNLPWQELSGLSSMTQTKFLFFGECRNRARTLSGLSGEEFVSLELALNQVFATAKAKDIVLLSPGGTSWDEFKGFEDRGRFFKEKIKIFSKS